MCEVSIYNIYNFHSRYLYDPFIYINIFILYNYNKQTFSAIYIYIYIQIPILYNSDNYITFYRNMLSFRMSVDYIKIITYIRSYESLKKYFHFDPTFRFVNKRSFCLKNTRAEKWLKSALLMERRYFFQPVKVALKTHAVYNNYTSRKVST
jgi:hypothetical protein